MKGHFYVSHSGFVWWSDYKIEPAAHLQHVNCDIRLGKDMFKMLYPESLVGDNFFRFGLSMAEKLTGFHKWLEEEEVWDDNSYR